MYDWALYKKVNIDSKGLYDKIFLRRRNNVQSTYRGTIGKKKPIRNKFALTNQKNYAGENKFSSRKLLRQLGVLIYVKSALLGVLRTCVPVS